MCVHGYLRCRVCVEAMTKANKCVLGVQSRPPTQPVAMKVTLKDKSQLGNGDTGILWF